MSLFSMPGKEKHSGASFEKNSALRFPWTRSLTSPDFILLASSGTPEKTPGTGMLPRRMRLALAVLMRLPCRPPRSCGELQAGCIL